MTRRARGTVTIDGDGRNGGIWERNKGQAYSQIVQLVPCVGPRELMLSLKPLPKSSVAERRHVSRWFLPEKRTQQTKKDSV